jgi:5-methyltetrahydrofolate--homocysteine methyltransferase
MPIGADSTVGRTTLETIRGIRERWGLNTTCGASNVSFGMPGRHAINGAWLSLAMSAGMTSAIMDARTPAVVDAVRAADLLLGNDEWGMSWIATHRARQAAEAAGAT